MNPKISVIMPVFNVEDYLEEALDCILNQTFIENMEVLMIDDGSSDNSRYIIEKYALDYDNFHAFHKENEGAAPTRNLGIEMAKGDYINFFDADDYLTDDWYERLYDMAVTTGSNIVTSPIIRLIRYNTFDGTFYRNSFKNIPQNISSTRFEDTKELIWDLFITNKLYKKEFINKNNLRFIDENRYYCDDTPFSLKAYLLSDSVSVSKDVLYYWRVREDENLSSTQKITQVKNFKDRMYAVRLYMDIFEGFELGCEFMHNFYKKILDYDLYVHFSKFHMYDAESYPEIIDEANKLLSNIPQECIDELNSVKQVIYQMVKDESIDDLYEFTKAESSLKQNPCLPDDIDRKYADMLDFENDALLEDLVVKKENVCLEEDSLLIEFSQHVNYLNDDYPHETHVKLIEGNDEYPLEVNENKIIIPLDLISSKKHMKIKVEYISDKIKKESYLLNSKREIIELEGYDIEVGIETNRQFCMDIRKTSDLDIEIKEIRFENNVFEFMGSSEEPIEKAYIQNVVTFEKITYPVEYDQDEFTFSIPYEDILSYPVRKWELKVENTFKTIKIDRKIEFFMQFHRIYIINARNKLLISDDLYDSLDLLGDYSEKILDLNESRRDLRKLNNQFKRDNRKLEKENKKLNKKNKKLKNENSRLNEKNTILENKVVNFHAAKTKILGNRNG